MQEHTPPNFEKYIQWLTMLSLTIRLAVVASRICVIPRNSLKIRTYSPWSSKVIDLGVNRKCIYDFLLVIHSNFGFRDIDV